MNVDINKVSKYIGSRESIYVLLLIVLTIINLIVFSKQPMTLLGINIVVIVLYFSITQREDKAVLLLACVNFAFWGIILESFIIKNSNFALKYRLGSNMEGLYVPAWLFTVYIVFVIASLYTYDFYKTILLNKKA